MFGPHVEVPKQKAESTFLQNFVLFSCLNSSLSFTSSQTWIPVSKVQALLREKQVSPATTCTTQTARQSLTNFAFPHLGDFATVSAKGPVPCCPEEGAPWWVTPSPLIPNLSLSNSDAMLDSPVVEVQPAWILCCLGVSTQMGTRQNSFSLLSVSWVELSL